jgi:hypothetical protein
MGMHNLILLQAFMLSAAQQVAAADHAIECPFVAGFHFAAFR